MKKIIGLLSFTFVLGLWADETVKVESPDGKYVAVIDKFTNDEAVVRIENKTGARLAYINLQSQGSSQGEVVSQSEWSKDSKFFVFSTANSGGHNVHFGPTYFYSRKSETFRNVGDRLGKSVISDTFSVSKDDVITLTTRLPGEGIDNEIREAVSLSNLDAVRDDESQQQ